MTRNVVVQASYEGILRDHMRRIRVLEAAANVIPTDLLQVAVDFSTSGDHTILAAPGAGLVIQVVGGVIIAAGDVNIKFKDGTPADLTGVMALTANSGFSVAEVGMFKCATNKSLVINHSVAIQVGGWLVYRLLSG